MDVCRCSRVDGARSGGGGRYCRRGGGRWSGSGCVRVVWGGWRGVEQGEDVALEVLLRVKEGEGGYGACCAARPVTEPDCVSDGCDAGGEGAVGEEWGRRGSWCGRGRGRRSGCGSSGRLAPLLTFCWYCGCWGSGSRGCHCLHANVWDVRVHAESDACARQPPKRRRTCPDEKVEPATDSAAGERRARRR